MKRYSVAHVRRRLADVLDEAAAGNPVVIERRGMRYVLKVDDAAPRKKRAGRPSIEIVDPDVASGRWHWTLTSRGMRFNRRRRS
jgi:antitoxin (DNA-binding transcriptional repressor) of toxin-antitoxin stability system